MSDIILKCFSRKFIANINSCFNNTHHTLKSSKKIRVEKVLVITIQKVNQKMLFTAFYHNLHHFRALNIKGGFEKKTKRRID